MQRSCYYNSTSASVLSLKVSSVGVEAVLGHSASLPCDIAPSGREDRVYMVLWFREGAGRPLYRFDVRGRPLPEALHWSDPLAFGFRAYFAAGTRPAALTLDAVQLDDEGAYRCRVDFRNSPTRNFLIRLVVIVPPHHMLVYANSGRPISSDVIGPLSEGAELVLSCEVRGGKPPPTVSWLVNEQLVGGARRQARGGVAVSRLHVGRVGREDLNTSFTCQASNSQLAPPLHKSARLELFLRPLSARLLQRPAELVAGVQVSLSCEVLGSRPPAVVTWWRDSRKLRRGEVETSGGEGREVSTLTFSPAPEDDGRLLQCRADNPSMAAAGLDDSLALNVVYPPLVSLRLGSTLDAADIKQGEDVYFECEVRANPREHRIAWTHDGAAVGQNVSWGVILSTSSLVLQGVSRRQGGHYACSAANDRGETTSEPVLLRVQFAPVCRHPEHQVVGASLHEALQLRCVVDADPAAAAFEWQFNHSGDGVDAPRRLAGSLEDGASSVLEYIPVSERDYGMLACWGRNTIGRQADPCVFQVVPAVRPSPLRNCTLRPAANLSTDALDVECLAGYDGGLPQSFVLEAYESRTMRLRLNATAPRRPFFRVELDDLLPAHTPALHLVLYAVNQKGRGEVTVLEGITLGDTEKRTELISGASEGAMDGMSLAAVLTGAVLTGGLAVLLVAVLAVRRRRLPPDENQHETFEATKQKPPGELTRHVSIAHAGDQNYVMSYVVKPAGDCCRKPDILNPSRGVNVYCRQPISPQENSHDYDEHEDNFTAKTYGQITR
ncbi:nephrin-like [Bacillus rossius redtenbacheri]|uniref:nephrin-like n=1 Tax=Bacillus rossius redtenbacheri TaxID=93214 RepID=UPI002FDC7AF0